MITEEVVHLRRKTLLFKRLHTKQKSMVKQEERRGFLLALPVFIGVAIFFAAPFCITLWYSLTFGVGIGKFVGLQNYIDVFKSSAFQLAAKNTLRFISIGIPLIILISFILALMLHLKFSGTKLFRTILLFPMIVPIASLVMVTQIFFAQNGIINTALYTMGMPISDWLNSPSAFGILLVLYIWKNCGYNIILILAALNMISVELYQSADIEGATSFQKLRFITLPLIYPSMFFVVVISIINSFKSYREAFLLGGKYPHDSIYGLQHFLNNNFENLNYQRLSVAAIMLFSVIFAVVALMYYLQAKHGGSGE